MTGTGSRVPIEEYTAIINYWCMTTYAHGLKPSHSQHREQGDECGRLAFNIPAELTQG